MDRKDSRCRVGQGLVAYFGAKPVEGIVREVRTLQDIIALDGENIKGSVILVRKAGVTGLIPILSRIGAVICTTGGVGSHLAIIAREFGIPCIMGTTLERAKNLNGKKVLIEAKDGLGEIFLKVENDGSN